MSDAQRIHPHNDPEAPPSSTASPPGPTPTAPLIPSQQAKSDTPQPYSSYPPPPLPPPPHHKHRRSPCRRFCCCITCTLLALILLILLAAGIFAAILFLAFHPKIPKYSIDTFQVTQFNLDSSADTLSATLHVNLTAYNPNKHIGIYYSEDSHLSVYHDDVELCNGSLPVFYQGHRNTTVIQIPLNGYIAHNARQVATQLATEASGGNGVPLQIRGKVPVKIKIGKLKLKKMKFKVKCDLVVDSFATNDQIKISRSNCNIKIQVRSIFF